MGYFLYGRVVSVKKYKVKERFILDFAVSICIYLNVYNIANNLLKTHINGINVYKKVKK